MRTVVVAFCLLIATAPVYAQPRAVVALIEDNSDALIQMLNNDGGLDATKIRIEYRDVYSGVAAIHVTPFQRFAARIPNWGYTIVEKPEPGQYRYLRFAWKRITKGEQAGIMIQLHTANNGWNNRYYAGVRSNQTATWGPMIQVDPKLPTEWTVVTRDLFKDFGAQTITGIALTPMENGVAGLFDHFYLGRTIEDLDRASAEAFGKVPPKEPLTILQMGELWENLAKPDVNINGPAVRKLVAGHKESVPYLAKMLAVKPVGGDVKQITRWIEDLGNEEFQIREAAYRALQKLDDSANRILQEARAKASSVEQRRRIEDLLTERGIVEGQLTSHQLRMVRAIRVLEWSATPEALAALDALAKEPRDTDVLPDIQQARARLAKMLKK